MMSLKQPNDGVDAAGDHHITAKMSMRSRLVPLASNDLFGGAHLGQSAERIQAAQPFKQRRVGARRVTAQSHTQRNAERFHQPNTIRSPVEENLTTQPRSAQLFPARD